MKLMHIKFIKNYFEVEYNHKIINSIERTSIKEESNYFESFNEKDEMLPKAIEVVVELGQASTSIIQRKLKLGYTRAARIMDEMEEMGIVGPYEGSKPRQVLITKSQCPGMTFSQLDEEKGNYAESFDEKDEMLPKAIEVVVELGQASTSLLQRKLRLGYARAARIMDEMEEMGIVGPYEGSKPRQVLITKNQWLEMTLSQSE